MVQDNIFVSWHLGDGLLHFKLLEASVYFYSVQTRMSDVSKLQVWFVLRSCSLSGGGGTKDGLFTQGVKSNI